MPRPYPHPLAVFSLKPLNQRACDVVNHPANDRLVSRLIDGTLALDVGHFVSESGDAMTLATLGRNADIIIPGASISKIQCSFEIDPDTNVVMFYDRSHNLSSQVFGEENTPFEYGRPRRVVVRNCFNTKIGMGGEQRQLVYFELTWHYDPMHAMEKVKDRQCGALEVNPRLARTIDEADTTALTRMATRPHISGPGQPKMRYSALGAKLGSGAFGTVEKVVNADTSKLMALKRVKRPSGEAEEMALSNVLKREVENLSRLSHPHIVDYIAFEGGGEVDFKIFMGLKEGTLQSLIENNSSSLPDKDVGYIVFRQMLQAIDFLATEDIIHRDVKPANILYVVQSSQYCFQLSDFGLSNSPSIARTLAGSPLYMAPEISQGGRQTHKVDVWSLCATILWTLDVDEFRQRSNEYRSFEDCHRAVQSRAPKVRLIEEMGRVNPEERASAAQMLIKCFDGEGLSTPRNQVPALEDNTAQTGAEPRTATVVPIRKPKKFVRKRRLAKRAPQVRFRVGKARHVAKQPNSFDHPASKKWAELESLGVENLPGVSRDYWK
ncbi:kinase-like domain-containing protein [Ustulina deusta]|nr:kinase-like domain-containing protein [Ustulina deusta]